MKAIAQHTSQIKNITEIEKQIGGWNSHLGKSNGHTFSLTANTSVRWKWPGPI
jgi:hypothetical protein